MLWSGALFMNPHPGDLHALVNSPQNHAIYILKDLWLHALIVCGLLMAIES